MVQRITIAPQGPEFSRFVMGYWRLMDWNMSARQVICGVMALKHSNAKRFFRTKVVIEGPFRHFSGF